MLIGLSFVFAIVVHETGHLIGSKFDGATLKAFVLFGHALVKESDGRYSIRRAPGLFGQCVTRPAGEDAPAVATIIGGPIANLLTGGLFIIISVVSFFRWSRYMDLINSPSYERNRGLFLFGLFVCNLVVLVLNLYLGVSNLIASPKTRNDGDTLKEARRSTRHLKAYNNILTIACELIDGKSYMDMDEGLFSIYPGKAFSSLFADIFLFGYYRKLEERVKDKEISDDCRHDDCEKYIARIEDKCSFGAVDIDEEEWAIEERILEALFFGRGELLSKKDYSSAREWLYDCALAAGKKSENALGLLWLGSEHEVRDLYRGDWKCAREIVEERIRRTA